MADLTILDTAEFTCPRCKTTNTSPLVIEHKEGLSDRVKCLVCAVYFYRVGKTGNCYVSQDEKRIYITKIQS
jgi:transcription elongation factor Elf1